MKKTVEIENCNGVAQLLAHFETGSAPILEPVDIQTQSYKEFINETINSDSIISKLLKTEYNNWLDNKKGLIKDYHREIEDVAKLTNDYFSKTFNGITPNELAGLSPVSHKNCNNSNVKNKINMNVRVIRKNALPNNENTLSTSIEQCSAVLKKYTENIKIIIEKEKKEIEERKKALEKELEDLKTKKNDYLKKYVVPHIHFYDVQDGFYVIQSTDTTLDVLVFDEKQLNELFSNLTRLKFDNSFIDLTNFNLTEPISMEFLTVDELYKFVSENFKRIKKLSTTLIAEDIIDEAKLIYLTTPDKSKILVINRDHIDADFQVEYAYIVYPETEIIYPPIDEALTVTSFSQYLDIRIGGYQTLRNEYNKNYKKLIEFDESFKTKFEIKINKDKTDGYTIDVRLFGNHKIVTVGKVDNIVLAETIKSQFENDPDSLLKLYTSND